jgi:hypothetical protein
MKAFLIEAIKCSVNALDALFIGVIATILIVIAALGGKDTDDLERFL